MSQPTRTYSLAITRTPTVPEAGGLAATGGALSPVFASGTTIYTLPDTPYPALSVTARPLVPGGGLVEIQNGSDASQTRMPGATVAVSDNVVLALRPDGSVKAFGSGPVAAASILPSSGVVGIAAGRDYALALRRDGSIYAWGIGSNGQLSAPADANYVAVAAGAYHCLALTASGRVVAWGLNNYQQTRVPDAVLSDVIAIAAGERTSIALKADGTVVAWGRGSVAPQTIPVDAQANIVAVAAGSDHYLALRSDGRVVQWGSVSNFVDAPPFSIIGIAAGDNDSMALRANGAVVTWSSPGAVGFNIPVAASRDVAAMCMGRYLGAVLRHDGSLLVIAAGSSSLMGANDTPAYAGPYALPFSARVPLAVGANTLSLRFSRPDALADPVVYQIGVTRTPAPELRMVAGTDLITGNPYSYNFGDFLVGRSRAQLFTLHNPGTAELLISSAQMFGSGAADFSVSGLTFPQTVPAGGSITFTITAAPSAVGYRVAAFLPTLNLPNGEGYGFALRANGFTFASELAAWRYTQFTAEELADPALETSVWGHLADPDGDGMPNLLEYALGLAARFPDVSPLQVSIDPAAPGGPALKLGYTRPKRAAEAGLVYRVVWSDTLEAGSWSAAGVVEEVVDINATTETVTATKTADGERRFLRLEVTAP